MGGPGCPARAFRYNGTLTSEFADLLAVSLARTSGLEEGEVAEIYRKYGDHLYDKGDFDGAMQQFIKTVGKVQPSYVIRKVRAIRSEPCRHVQHSRYPLSTPDGADTLSYGCRSSSTDSG